MAFLNDYKVLSLVSATLLTSGGGSTVIETPIPFTTAIDPTPDDDELVYTGDGTVVKYSSLNDISWAVTADSQNMLAIGNALGITDVTTVSGESHRMYFGSQAEEGRLAGFRLRYRGKQATSAVVNIELTVPVASVTVKPFAFTNKGKSQTVMIFRSQKTTTDIGNNPLSNVPSDGCHGFYSVLTS